VASVCTPSWNTTLPLPNMSGAANVVTVHVMLTAEPKE
jgi:hypothetical protein